MAWGAEDDATQLTSITTEQFFDDTPTLTPGEVHHVRVEVDFPTSPTDNAIVAVYGSLDGTNWDDTPLLEFEIDNATDPNQVSFVVSGIYQYRVGVRRNGTTDTITSADMSRREDGVSL